MVGGSDQVGPHTAQRAIRFINELLVVAILIGCVIVLQKSFHFVTILPQLNVDDSIPNVAVDLAEHGRYGFLSSPTQGLYNVDRTHAFFNYGPLYFWVAAALTWFFGPSLTLFRMLHPAGLVFIVLASLLVFRRVSVIGSAILAVALFETYFAVQWPIARPDIFVSICVALMFIFASKAIEKSKGWDWFWMGFWAVGAVTTHQIAAAMIPAAGVIWAWSLLVQRRNMAAGFLRSAAVSGGALLSGGALGVFVYLLAIDFRLRDLWSLGSAGVKGYSAPYFQVLAGHFNFAWGSLPLFDRLLPLGGSWVLQRSRSPLLG